jgi:glycosyltransferase involved in cell wall biosynthesis
MNKKVLMLAAKANMIQQFNHRNIRILQDLGYEVHVATNMADFGSMSLKENESFKIWMNNNGVIAHQIDFERRMGSLKGNMRSVRQLRRVFKQNDFSFVHVHSPLGGILGRMVAKMFGIPVIYTVHGFHFFKGGPKRAWIIFYPLEWLFSFITDVLITINDEDFELAKKHMHAKKIEKINGIGVDIKKSWNTTDEYRSKARNRIRGELKIPMDALLISSIGELSDRKNHKVVLEALNLMSERERKNIYYIIAGTGDNENLLNQIAKSFNFENHFRLLGYRNDIHDINYASDISIFPSFREGLGVAGLDATVDGTFLIASNRRGISDYVQNGTNGITFDPYNASQLVNIIRNKNVDKTSKFPFLRKFDKHIVDSKMKSIYGDIL